jgi:RNA polymerase sigma-70 factor (ECF subfamily)
VPDAPPPQPSSDDERLRVLMRRYQSGEISAFEELYVLTLPMVRGHLAALTIDRSMTIDLTQEVYLQAHRSRHTYDGSRPVRPWLAGIARHVWLMARRSYARRQSPEVAGLDQAVDLTVDPEFERLGDRITLSKALAQVAADHREALVLHHLYGLSFRDISRVLGITEGAARIRASRATGALRALIVHGNRHG